MQGRPEAAAAVWSWRGGKAEAERAGPADDGRLRLRGALHAGVGGAVGAAIFLLWSPIAGTVVMSIAGAILLAALISPAGAFSLLDRAFAALGFHVARGLTFVLMTAIFYLIFVPFGALFRRGRRDPMKRFHEPEADTYWSPRERGRAGSPSRARQY